VVHTKDSRQLSVSSHARVFCSYISSAVDIHQPTTKTPAVARSSRDAIMS
jgi:hypothetical protein